MNIALVGMMASGKTTIAKALAQELGWKFIDLDVEIEARAGKPIARIFSEDGEQAFRWMERIMLSASVSEDCCIIACGGGMMANAQNREILRTNALSIFLEVRPEIAAYRIADASTRPLIAGRNKEQMVEELSKLLEQRVEEYKKAQIIVDAEKPVIEVLGEITSILRTKPRVCACITSATEEDAIRDIMSASKAGAETIELRLDLMPADIDLKSVISAAKKLGLSVIATLRDRDEGGKFGGTDVQKESILMSAIDAGADMVDVEQKRTELSRRLKEKCHERGSKLIVSSHDFVKSLSRENLETLLENGRQLGDIVKISVMSSDGSGAVLAGLLKKAKAENVLLIASAMGENAYSDRLACALQGSLVIFSAIGKAAAPGQPSTKKIISDLRMIRGKNQHSLMANAHSQRISPSTKIFAVIGDPIGHSLSPAMFNAAFDDSGIDAIYLALRVAPDELKYAVAGMRAIGVCGWNVTIPHKSSIMEHLDDVDEIALSAGAVNTVVNRNGKLIGYNSDVIGFKSAVEKLAGSSMGMDVVLLGSGGAAKAALSVLGDGNKITILNRTVSKASDISKKNPRAKITVLELNGENLELVLNDADLLVNATPVGLSSDETPVPKGLLQKGIAVFDLVYRKGKQTRLVREASEAGCKACDGTEMLLQQGAAAFKIVTGNEAPIETMRQALHGEKVEIIRMDPFTIGNNFKVKISGSSHGPQLGVEISGCPKGVTVNEADIQSELDKRKPGQNFLATQRKEEDKVIIDEGIDAGKTTGGLIRMHIINEDRISAHYDSIKDTPRPGHADFPARMKWGLDFDLSGGSFFSGRMTACMVMAGAIAKAILREKGIRTMAFTKSIANIEAKSVISDEEIEANTFSNGIRTADLSVVDGMAKLIKAARADSDSVGGVVECRINGLQSGIGDPMFGSIESRISEAIFGIPAVKGIEFGSGFNGTRLRGSQNNDPFAIRDGKVIALSNNSGGILGGLATGMPVVFRVAVKPTSSIAKPQKSVNLRTMEGTTIVVNGRHDPCIVPRAVPVVENIAAIVIADILLADKT